ncbi:MAG: 2OG-Fe(II) oxygenase [Allosphingosinicella sp.]
MSETPFDAAAAALRQGDAAGARALLARAAEAGDARAAAVHANFLASGVGGPRDWPGALARLRELAGANRRAARELALIEKMALIPEGDPVALPRGEIVCERPRILRFAALLTREEGRYLAEAALAMLRPAVVVDPATGEQRPDPVRVADAIGFTAPLENPAVHALNRRFAAASGTAPEQGEPLQVLRYRPGGEYRTHCDALPGLANQRVMTLLVWLNDGYRGGATAFPAAKLALRGAPGDAILFVNAGPDGRADPAAAHAGLPVEAGEKWMASRWIRARPYSEYGA